MIGCTASCQRVRAVAQLCSALTRPCDLQSATSLSHHHLHELLVVDLPISVNVGLADHLIDLFVRQLLAKVRHHMTQLGGADEAIAVAIENLEGLDQLLLS